jgi:hypothetical protein
MRAAAAIPSTPCQPAGVTRADSTIAASLRRSMNGPRLGRAVTGYSISCARAIVRTVQARGLGHRAAVIAVTTAIAESTLHNYTRAVDHDSLGLFQQRPSMGWGRPVELTDPIFATHAFLNAMLRKHPALTWMTREIGAVCQKVQNSAYPAAYTPEAHDAQLIVTALWPQTAGSRTPPAGTTPDGTTPEKDKTEPAPETPKGPFQRALLTAPTGRAAIDDRYDASLADWNGDRRPDLVVVQRAETVTGRTELYILDGTTNFQRLLLHTGTVLGPTDARYTFSMADWNADGRLDLVVLQGAGTASGRTELRVIDGASSFQRYLLEVGTGLGPTDDRHSFAMADWNADGRLDLMAIQKSGTASKKTEVRVLDGASNFQQLVLETPTALGPTDARHDLSIADWNGDARLDLVLIQRTGAKSGKTEVRVLDGATKFQRNLLQARTAQEAVDDRYDLLVTDWNGDRRPDLVVLQKSGTPSGRTEARILAG